MDQARHDRGYVLVAVALLLAVLLSFVGLSVDLGVGYSARTEAQRAADAGALAGAFTFVNSPFADQPATAESRARETALVNSIMNSSIQPGDINVSVDLANRRVTVDISHTQDTCLARVMNLTEMDIAVSATAEASNQAGASNCTKPWFIPNTILSDLPPCDACLANEVIFAPGPPRVLTAWARSKFQLAPLKGLKPQTPSGALEPSQFYAIKIGGSGAAVYRENIATCGPLAVLCNNLYPVETGNMVGPTNQGVDDLTWENHEWCGYSGQGVPQFGENGCGPVFDTSPQLVVAPIWDTCYYQFNGEAFCPGNIFPTGQHGGEVQIPVIGFALIFVGELQPPDQVMARLLGAFPCAGGVGTADDVGPFSVPLRLVRVVE